MALTFPRTDILAGCGFAQKSFALMLRQEYSRPAGGVTIGKDMGPALWTVEYVTVPQQFSDMVTYEAMLRSLDGVIHPFSAYDMRRPYPLAHANGDFSDSGKIKSVGSNNKSLALKNLPAGFIMSVGDYLSFTYGSNPSSRALHQVMEVVVAGGSGETGEFEVRPHLRAGASPDTAVTLKKPTALFTLQPGGLSSEVVSVVLGTVGFRAIQYI